MQFDIIAQARFYDDDMNPLYATENEFTFYTEGTGFTSYTAQADIVYNNPAKYMDLVFFLKPESGVPMVISMQEIYFTVTLTQTQMDYLSTERTLALMQAIKDAQANSTITLPDNWFGSVEDTLNNIFYDAVGVPIYPDRFEDHQDILNDKDGLMENTQDGLEQIQSYVSQALDYIYEAAVAFSAVSWIFNVFYHHSYFVALLVISLALGCFASLFGIVVQFGSSAGSSRSVSKAGKDGSNNKHGK